MSGQYPHQDYCYLVLRVRPFCQRLALLIPQVSRRLKEIQHSIVLVIWRKSTKANSKNTLFPVVLQLHMFMKSVSYYLEASLHIDPLLIVLNKNKTIHQEKNKHLKGNPPMTFRWRSHIENDWGFSQHDFSLDRNFPVSIGIVNHSWFLYIWYVFDLAWWQIIQPYSVYWSFPISLHLFGLRKSTMPREQHQKRCMLVWEPGFYLSAHIACIRAPGKH